MSEVLSISTKSKTQVVNVTSEVQDRIGSWADSIALLQIPHTTAALIVSEDDDDLRADLARFLKVWLATSRPFTHSRNANPNAEAHISSSMLGSSVLVPVLGGRLQLGRWQQLLLIEMDGPKERSIACWPMAFAMPIR